VTPSGPAIPEKPILFSGAMVKAILAGQKSQTRRVVKPQPQPWEPNVAFAVWRGDEPVTLAAILQGSPLRVGMRLWVRETWLELDPDHWAEPSKPRDYPNPMRTDGSRNAIAYRASTDADGEDIRESYGYKWRPSIFMPRWASRITLEITDVRVQRVAEISADDAVAEGVKHAYADGSRFPLVDQRAPLEVHAYAHLWDLINGKRPGCSWADNPFVWAISFKVSGPAILSQGDGQKEKGA
jgi:hypothetical protein